MERMKHLIKDYKALDLIWRIIKDGILIGAFCSQWFANTFLQPLDQIIRNSKAKLYIRYMDNFTIFVSSKRDAARLIVIIEEWLNKHKLKLKGNWQKFKTSKRMPNALGYRYGRKYGKAYVLLRKNSLLRLVRLLKKYYKMRERGDFITVKFAQGLLSRLGMLRHCNSVKLYKRFIEKRTQKSLKNIVRKEQIRWKNMFSDTLITAA